MLLATTGQIHQPDAARELFLSLATSFVVQGRYNLFQVCKETPLTSCLLPIETPILLVAPIFSWVNATSSTGPHAGQIQHPSQDYTKRTASRIRKNIMVRNPTSVVYPFPPPTP